MKFLVQVPDHAMIDMEKDIKKNSVGMRIHHLCGRVLLILLALTLPIKALAELPKSILFAATDWCPYSCDLSNHPGIVTEYLTRLLAPHDIEIKVDILPWGRAIHYANTAKVAGLLTAVPSEAPDLYFTSIPTMSYSVCFFSRKESDWQFDSASSLKNRILGASLNYSYGEEVDPYIKRNSDKRFIYLLTGDNKITRFASMIRNNRLDSFIEDQYVTEWQLKTLGENGAGIKSSGCLPSHPFYLAINPSLEWSQEFIDLLNRLLALESSKIVLQGIIDNYIQQ